MAAPKPKTNRKKAEAEKGNYDDCQTPGYGLEPILPYLKTGKLIWEPAFGEGYLVRALAEAGHTVIGTDILFGQDFFSYTKPIGSVIVTNPPYSGDNKYLWTKHACELDVPFALLMQVEWQATEEFHSLAVPYDIEIVSFHPRIDFKMPNVGWKSSAQFATQWYCRMLTGSRLTYTSLSKPPKKVRETWT